MHRSCKVADSNRPRNLKDGPRRIQFPQVSSFQSKRGHGMWSVSPTLPPLPILTLIKRNKTDALCQCESATASRIFSGWRFYTWKRPFGTRDYCRPTLCGSLFYLLFHFCIRKSQVTVPWFWHDELICPLIWREGTKHWSVDQLSLHSVMLSTPTKGIHFFFCSFVLHLFCISRNVFSCSYYIILNLFSKRIISCLIFCNRF